MMSNPKILDNSSPQFQLKTYLTELLTSNKFTEIDLLVIDESHNLKTQGSQSFQNLLQLIAEKEVLEKQAREIFEAEKAYQDTVEGIDLESFMGVKQAGGATSLARYKEELLRILQENTDRYSKDNINRVKSLLTSRNLAVENRIRNYLKRYDNQASLDLLDTLTTLSANIIKNEAPQQAPESKLWFGWHSEQDCIINAILLS